MILNTSMNFLSLFSGAGGMDLGLEKAGMKCVGQIEIMPYALKILSKHWPNTPKHTDILTFCARDGLARIIQSQVKERVTKVKKAVSGQKLSESSEYSYLNGLSGKMFPDFSLSTMDMTFGKSFPSLIRSGIVWRGACWIQTDLGWHNGEKECSLSEVLETLVPQKYYLTSTAIAGIIRRSKLRSNKGGYVFLQETGKDKTPQLRLLSVRRLEQMITPAGIKDTKNQTSSPIPCKPKTQKDLFARQHLSQEASQHQKEIAEMDYQGITLRKLTPTEKERLQGFPKDWTLVEE